MKNLVKVGPDGTIMCAASNAKTLWSNNWNAFALFPSSMAVAWFIYNEKWQVDFRQVASEHSASWHEPYEPRRTNKLDDVFIHLSNSLREKMIAKGGANRERKTDDGEGR